MSWILGSITLPRPVKFERRTIETGVEHITLDGTTKKDISNRKEQFILTFQYLTQAEVSNILGEYNLQAVRDFSVSDGSLTITTTSVHIDLKSREYPASGSEFREDLELILTEVV